MSRPFFFCTPGMIDGSVLAGHYFPSVDALSSPKTGRTYQGGTYSKGAYVLLVLQSLLYSD